MLSSKQIEIFYQVYKNNSATAAAQILSISQPSVSKTLKIIEKNIGYKLFLRKGKKLLPTNEADALFEHASIVTNQIKNFNYIANTYKARSSDFINIGTTPSLSDSFVPKIIKKYKDLHENAKFNIINLNSIDLIEDRYKPDIDITICFNAKDDSNFNNIILKKGIHKLKIFFFIICWIKWRRYFMLLFFKIKSHHYNWYVNIFSYIIKPCFPLCNFLSRSFWCNG